MSHPEDTCQRCGQRNVYAWSAPNREWNIAMRAPDGREASEQFGIVCPQCFTEIHAEVTGRTTVWHLVPDEKPPASAEAAVRAVFDGNPHASHDFLVQELARLRITIEEEK